MLSVSSLSSSGTCLDPLANHSPCPQIDPSLSATDSSTESTLQSSRNSLQSATSQSQHSRNSSNDTSVPSVSGLNSSSRLSHTLEEVPLLSGLSLGANCSQSLAQSATTVPKKRTRQTKEQMRVYREEQDRLKRLKAAEEEEV